jgi:hypothetical protein
MRYRHSPKVRQGAHRRQAPARVRACAAPGAVALHLAPGSRQVGPGGSGVRLVLPGETLPCTRGRCRQWWGEVVTRAKTRASAHTHRRRARLWLIPSTWCPVAYSHRCKRTETDRDRDGATLGTTDTLATTRHQVGRRCAPWWERSRVRSSRHGVMYMYQRPKNNAPDCPTIADRHHGKGVGAASP